MATVMVVDDSKTSRKLLEDLLESHGHEVVATAVNGEEAFSLYKDMEPDLVTMDITMPVLDGLNSLKKIKMYDPKAKIIMVTAAGQKSKMVESIKYGADEFVTKPYNEDELIATINRILSQE